VSWAHEHLGIGDDADERAIKRAYAVKLRTTRPDEDPEGFQQLNDAYQTALGMLRHRLAQEQFAAQERDTDSEPDALAKPAAMDAIAAHAPPEDVDHDGSAEVAQQAIEADVVDDAEPQGEAITLDQFLDACLDAAGDGDPRVLEHWLRSQPVLWSLEHKAMIGHWLLRLMDARQPPMTERNFDILAEFFGYNDLHAGYDPLALQRLRARLIEAWRELQAQRRWQRPSGEPVPYSFTSIAQSHQTSAPAPQQWTDDDEQLDQTRRVQAWRHRLMRQFAHLVEKPSRLRDLRLLMNPDHAVQLRAFLHDNPYGDLDDLPVDIRRDEVAFWLSVADDRHWHRRRVLVAMLRCALLTLPIFPIVLLVQMGEAPENGVQLSMAFESAFYPFAGLMLAWLGIASLKSLLYWQGDPPPDTRGWRMTHRCAVPALVQCSVVGMMIDHASPLVFFVGMLALWAAVFRFVAMRRRATKRPPPILTHRVIAALFLIMLSSLLVYMDSDKGGGLILLSWFAAIVLWIATPGDRSATRP
jgi:hypothetical protein